MAYARRLQPAGMRSRGVVAYFGYMQTTGSVSAILPPRRRRLGASDAREAILAAAEALLVEAGPEALRLTEIAGRAGVTHPNVLYHFGSIAELERQLAQRIAFGLAERITRVFETDDGVPLPVERAVDAVFDVFAGGGFARLLAWLALSGNGPAIDDLGSRLGLVRASIAAHPALHGPQNMERRRRIFPAIELVIVAAIGYGLVGGTFDELFARNNHSVPVAKMLAEMIAREADAVARR